MAGSNASAVAVGDAGTEPAVSGRSRRRDDVVFLLLAAAVTFGLFLDGWAHIHLSSMETFFTPWHAVFYGAVAASEGWLLTVLVRNVKRGSRGLSAIPEGYGLSVIGAAAFPVAGLADFLWHSAFGIEADIAALLSPTHLLLLSAGVLMFSGPLRSSWRRGSASERTGLRDVLPALGALTMAAAWGGFFLEYLSPFVNDDPFAVAWSPGAEHDAADDQVVIGIGSVLVTNLLILAPVLVLARSWRLPFGSVTFLASMVALVPSAVHGFEHGAAGLVAAPVGGLVADAVIRRLQRSPARPGQATLVAAALPLALWFAYFMALEIAGGLGWPPELWGGAVGLATLTGLALGLLIQPAAATELGRRSGREWSDGSRNAGGVDGRRPAAAHVPVR